jgi:hypothetical protein
MPDPATGEVIERHLEHQTGEAETGAERLSTNEFSRHAPVPRMRIPEA